MFNVPFLPVVVLSFFFFFLSFIFQTGGGKEEEVDLAPAVYALEELRYREKLAREEEKEQERLRRLNGEEAADEDEDLSSTSRAPSLTAADVARIKEVRKDIFTCTYTREEEEERGVL